MHEKDKQNMRIKFNMTHRLAKHERPFSDYNGLLKLQTKNNVPQFGKSYLNDKAAAQFTDDIAKIEKENPQESLSKARYFSVLNDGRADSSVTGQELIYVLFLDDEAVPKIKYFSIENQPTQTESIRAL